MTRLVKQSTTITVKMGPFVDKADGVTPKTVLTPTVKVSKNGGVLAARNSATAITHDADGYYAVELNATDTNTLGSLQAVSTDSANILPVYHELMVMSANVWDSLVGNTDLLQIDLTQIVGDATAALNFSKSTTGMILGTIAAGSTNAVYNTNLTEATDNHYKDRTVLFITGALAQQQLLITGYNGGTKAITVQFVTTDVPSNGDTFLIV